MIPFGHRDTGMVLKPLDWTYEPPCEQPDHDHHADWWVRTDCDHVLAWCNERFIQYQHNAAYGATIECPACRKLFTTITWWQSIKRAPKMPLG